MAYTLVISDEKISTVIDRIEKPVFTALEFSNLFKGVYRDDWTNFVKRYGDLGVTNRYSILDYFNNRLEYYSQSPDALIRPIPRFSSESSDFFREATEDEKKYYDRNRIMVFRKK